MTQSSFEGSAAQEERGEVVPLRMRVGRTLAYWSSWAVRQGSSDCAGIWISHTVVRIGKIICHSEM